MKFEKVSINQFMACWFDHEFENLSQKDFDIVYAEYVDVSGMYRSKACELLAYIIYLKNRILVLNTLIDIERKCIETFHKPFEEAFELFESFGYKVNWDGDEKKFLAQMDKMSSRLRTKMTELRHKEFEYKELKDSFKKNEQPIVQTRHDFIKMLNSFSKNGYHIDRDKTTVEELALMIKQIKDESTELALRGLQRT